MNQNFQQLKKISIKSDSVMKKIESLNDAFNQSLEPIE